MPGGWDRRRVPQPDGADCAIGAQQEWFGGRDLGHSEIQQGMEQGLGLTVSALNSIKLCQVVEADRRGEMVRAQLLLANRQNLLPDGHSLDVVFLGLQGIGMAQQRLEVAITAQWLKLPLGQMPGRGGWR